MAKKYHISKGANFGAEIWVQKMDNAIPELIYSNNLLDYFDRDIDYMNVFLHTNYRKEYQETLNTREFSEFMKPYLDDECDLIDDLPPNFGRKKLDFHLKPIRGDCVNALNDFINNTKTHWKPCIEYITQIMEIAKNMTTENLPLPQKSADGTIKGSFLTHNFPFSENAEDYVGRKDLGILPSEWFGVSECRDEGRMCSFFTKEEELRPDIHSQQRDKVSACFWEPKHDVPFYTLILDATNPDLQPLLQNDFFTYVKNKDNPDYLRSLSDVQLNTFQNIEALSHKCKKAVTKNPDWVAIPGGVPSGFAIGLIAHNVAIDDPNFAMCQEAADIFNVPLLNSNLDIVYVPEVQKGMKNATMESTDMQTAESKASHEEEMVR